MGITPLPPSAGSGRPAHLKAFVTGGAYALLFLLGLLEGVIGAFHYSRGRRRQRPAGLHRFRRGHPGITCGLSGWAMRGMPGALLPAIGWFVASFGLAMPNAGGSVIIANTSAGEWYLYGGAVCALLGVASSSSRRPAGPDARHCEGPPGGGGCGRNRMANGDVPGMRPGPAHDRGGHCGLPAGRRASSPPAFWSCPPRLDGVPHSMTVSAFTSVSLDPLLVLFCAEKIARFHEAVLAAGQLGGQRAGRGLGEGVPLAGHPRTPAGGPARRDRLASRPADRRAHPGRRPVRAGVPDHRRARRR